MRSVDCPCPGPIKGTCPDCPYPQKVAECGCKWYADGTKYTCVTHQSGGVYP